MSYFWIIPVFILLFAAIWGFYIGVRRNAGRRKDGTILTDEPHQERRI